MSERPALCHKCSQILKLEKLPEPKPDEKGFYRLARVFVNEQFTPEQAVVMIRLKFPNCIIHRAYLSHEYMGYVFMLTHESFPPRKGDAFEVPRADCCVTYQEDRWVKQVVNLPGALLCDSKTLREMYRDHTGGDEVHDPADPNWGQYRTVDGPVAEYSSPMAEQSGEQCDLASALKRGIEEGEDVTIEVKKEPISSRGGLYKAHCKRLLEERGSEEVPPEARLIKKSADRCPKCDGPDDHVPGGLHCRC